MGYKLNTPSVGLRVGWAYQVADADGPKPDVFELLAIQSSSPRMTPADGYM